MVYRFDRAIVREPAPNVVDGLRSVDRGAPTLARVLALEEGHADGGDVLVTPEVVFIGLSARTDRAGAAALARALATLGRKAVVVEPPPGVLHLKTACSLLDAGRLLVARALDALPEFAGFERLVVPADEEAAANALRVNDRVLLSAGHPRTRDLLAAAGLRVVELQTRQVGLLDAGLSCLSLRWSTSER